MRDPRRRAWVASVAGTMFILTLGLVPASVAGADHLDAPSISSKGATDITDVYAFSSADRRSSILIVGVNPGAGALPTSGITFGAKLRYLIKVDRNGDLKPDVIYTFDFDKPNAHGRQAYRLWRNGSVYAHGMTGRDTRLPGGGRVTAGLYDDPFFFDLDAFKGAVLGSGNGRSFCDGDEVDFFLGLNISALVLKVPNASIGGQGRTIGVWATTEGMRGGKWVQLDQMGRPAINTVFNNANDDKSDKELFNRTQPSEQVQLGFRSHAADVLDALGGDPGLADVLIPDVLTYETGNKAGFLNGRRLRNDVIDAELDLVTGGGITTDCISNDSEFSMGWPYLAPAN